MQWRRQNSSVCDLQNPLRILAFSVARDTQLHCWLRFISDMASADPDCAYQLHVETYNPRKTKSGRGHMSLHYWSFARQKVSFVRKALAEMPSGSRFIFTDLDVLPVRPFSVLLSAIDASYVAAHMRDIVFMKEPPGSASGFFNSGMYLARSNEPTRQFFAAWEDAVALADAHDGDQPHANRLLQRFGHHRTASFEKQVRSVRPGLSWSVFDTNTIAGTPASVLPGITVAYHAIFVGPDEVKAAMMHKVWSAQGGGAGSERIVRWCDAPRQAMLRLEPKATPCPAPFTELAFRSIIGTLLASDMLPPGSIIDAGANDGSDACFYAEAAPARTVHAIEPLRQNVLVMQQLAVGRPNLRAMQAGLGNRSGLVHPPPHLSQVGPGLRAQVTNFQNRRLSAQALRSNGGSSGRRLNPKRGVPGFTCKAKWNFIGQCVDKCPEPADDLDMCKARCLETPGCLAIVYNKYKQCYLKASIERIMEPADSQHGTIGCSTQHASQMAFRVHRVDNLFMGAHAPWKHERLGFAHFDLEGGELDVIRSAELTIMRDRPVFTIEINVHRERLKTRALLAHVSSLGYAMYAVLENCGAPWSDCRNVLAFPLDWLRRSAAALHDGAGSTAGLGPLGSVLDLAQHSSKLVQVTAKTFETRAGYPVCMGDGACCKTEASTDHRRQCPCLMECVQKWWRSQPSHVTARLAPPIWNQRASGHRLFFEQNFSQGFDR